MLDQLGNLRGLASTLGSRGLASTRTPLGRAIESFLPVAIGEGLQGNRTDLGKEGQVL